MQTRQVNVQRWSIISQRPFDGVIAAVGAKIGQPDMSEFVTKMSAATNYEETQKIVQESVGAIDLMEFLRLNHGAVLSKAGVGGNPRSIRLIIGNHFIMQSMARLIPDGRRLFIHPALES